MCFETHHKHINVKIAKKDIICYQILDQNKRSYIFRYLYETNKLNPVVELPVFTGNYYGRTINEGYHSYSNKKHARSIICLLNNPNIKRSQEDKDMLMANPPHLYRSIIPEDTKYYYNPFFKQFVSGNIILKEEI